MLGAVEDGVELSTLPALQIVRTLSFVHRRTQTSDRLLYSVTKVIGKTAQQHADTAVWR